MSLHIGHRDNPVDVIAPGDLDRAVLRVWHPTEGQARAGNYKMAHACINGLEVTIETPLDRFRSGVDPDGIPWKVQMPAHYGYVKGTHGSDGDHVDVYIGPDAHLAAALPVWIIDQCDADSGAYDEHKVMIGFPDRESAHKTYLAAFSDGRGHERIGGVARTDFESFRRWVNSPNTRIPIIMKKSASVPHGVPSYGTPTCRCNVCNGTPGGSMTDPVVKVDTTPSSIGNIMTTISKGLGRLTPTEIAEVLAEASALAKSEITKASGRLDSVDPHIPVVNDLWNGTPDGTPPIAHVHGPRSFTREGIPVGPSQEASGNGAERMERMYSTMLSAQDSFQSATERLGREIAGIRGAAKSIMASMEAQNVVIEVLKSAAMTPPATVDMAAIQTMIAETVAKSLGAFEKTMAKSLKAISVKASEKEGPEKEADKEAEEHEAAAKADDASTQECKAECEEDDTSDESAKSAAHLRLSAKARLKLAKARLFSAFEEGDATPDAIAKATAHREIAAVHVAKAESYVIAAKALRGTVGPSTEAIVESIAKAKKSLGDKPKMQDVWPSSDDRKTVKSESDPTVTATGGGDVATKALTEAAEKIQLAVKGFGVLTASVSDLMNTVAGQSRRGDGLPPVFSLAKADPTSLDAKTAAITELANTDVITSDDRDSALEVLRLAKMPGVQTEFVDAKLARLPTAVRKVLAAAA